MPYSNELTPLVVLVVVRPPGDAGSETEWRAGERVVVLSYSFPLLSEVATGGVDASNLESNAIVASVPASSIWTRTV